MRAILTLAALFALYQAPHGINDYLLPDRRIWLILTLAFVPAAHFASRALGGTGLRDYGLTPPASPNLPLGIALGIAFSAGAAALAHTLGLYRIENIATLDEILIPALVLAFGSALASIAEDILTRGFPWAYTGLRHTGTARFAAISAAFFLVNHVYVLKRGPALWAFIYVLGFGLAWALHRTQTIWLTFGAHWGWNIAFHWSNLALTTTDTAPSSANTWVSALAASALTATLILITRTAPKPATSS